MRPGILAFALLGCSTQVDAPLVAASSSGDPGGNIVDILAEGYGVPCLVVDPGETVEWRNFTPTIPTNVTSLGGPAELFSPNLVLPYNETSAAPTGRPDLVQAVSFWRHTFTRPGVYEYFDTNRGDPGRKVVDPYYGTVTFVGVGDDVRSGVVCVRGPAGDECDSVCCIKSAGQCPADQCCDLVNKRCVLTGPAGDQRLCEGAKPAFREFECFTDAGCPESGDCLATTHRCAEPPAE